jgi:hypothetical protein
LANGTEDWTFYISGIMYELKEAINLYITVLSKLLFYKKEEKVHDLPNLLFFQKEPKQRFKPKFPRNQNFCSQPL